MRKRILELIMACVLLVCFLLLSKEAVSVLRADEKDPVIVVDAGHGGMDPGVVGVNDVKEKEINLSIALKLKACLEDAGYQVVLTRDGDYALYEEGTSNMKKQDMNNRVELINKTNPVLTISVHQNSYPDESVYGPQVFYHENSSEGREIASNIQNILNEKLEIQKPREIKSNVSYYLLKQVETPIAIVECGFLTNPSESVLLQNEEYQQKVAEAIAEGVRMYMEKESSENTVSEEKDMEKSEEGTEA